MRRIIIWIAVALTALIAAEVAILSLVARWVGAAAVVLVMLGTAALGGWLLRREGLRTWQRFHHAKLAHRPAGLDASRGLIGLLAAFLLLMPGIMTDTLGLILLIPPIRTGAVRLGQRYAERRLSSATAGDLFGPRRVRSHLHKNRSTTPDNSPVLEGEIVD